MLDEVKSRCGILSAVTVYDDEIQALINDALEDLALSGVDEALIEEPIPGVVTAVVLYVRAYLGSDRSDTTKYMNLYRQKVFRLALADDGEE